MTALSPLQQVLDHIAITELRAKYCRFLDHKLWPQFRDLFTDDVDVDVGTLRCVGADEFVRSVRERTEGATTIHQCSMPELEIGDDAASGIWAMTDVVQRGPGPWPDGFAAFHGFGHYFEGYRRTPDGWRIASVRVERLRLEAITESGQAVVVGGASAGATTDQVSSVVDDAPSEGAGTDPR